MNIPLFTFILVTAITSSLAINRIITSRDKLEICPEELQCDRVGLCRLPYEVIECDKPEYYPNRNCNITKHCLKWGYTPCSDSDECFRGLVCNPCVNQCRGCGIYGCTEDKDIPNNCGIQNERNRYATMMNLNKRLQSNQYNSPKVEKLPFPHVSPWQSF